MSLDDHTRSLPALREALRRVLAEAAAPHAALGALAFGATVDATIDGLDPEVVVQLAPGDGRPCYRRTARLSVGFRGRALAPAGYTLVEAVCARLTEWESTLPAGAEALLFSPPPPAADATRLELLAVRCGAKPACRIAVADADASAVLERAACLGLVARRLAARTYSGSAADVAHLRRTGATGLVLAARTETELEALVAAEAGAGADPSIVGALLGYPPCCTAAFAAQAEQPKPAIRFAALRRTGAAAAAVLNDVDGGVSFVSHLVCRYDCAASVAIGDAVFAALAAAAPEEAERLTATRRGLMVVFADGGALRLLPGAGDSDARQPLASVHPTGDGPTQWEWRAALVGAQALVREADAVRLLGGHDGLPARLAAPPDRIQLRRFA